MLLHLLLLSPSLLAQPAAAPRRVLVRGIAWQDLEPERAELLLTYQPSDNVKDAERDKQQQAQLAAALRDFGIGSDKLTVNNLSAYGYGGFSKTGNTNVRLTREYRLVTDKPAVLNELIPRLVQSGADQVMVVGLESSRLEAFRLEVASKAVASKAVANARVKAQHIAGQVGAKLGPVRQVQEVLPETDRANNPAAAAKLRGAALYEGADDGAPLTSLRKIRVLVRLDVEYELQ